MADNLQGREAAIGIGEESTWGTPVARTIWRPLVSESLTRKLTKQRRADLKGTSASANVRGHFSVNEEAGGPLRVLATYDNIGTILKHALGSLATTGSNPYTHTFKLAADLPTGLTLEKVIGKSGDSEVFAGALINGLTLDVSQGGPMFLDLDVIARTAAARESAGSPSYAAIENVVLHNQAGQFSWNSVSYDLISLKVALGNALIARRFLGSTLTQRPERGDFSSVKFDLVLEMKKALYASLLADDQADGSIVFANGLRTFTIKGQQLYITDYGDPIGDAGIIRANVSMMAESDGTEEGLQIEVVNANSSGTAN